jgi:hypothetical protein
MSATECETMPKKKAIAFCFMNWIKKEKRGSGGVVRVMIIADDGRVR